jgi:hypothetical protein
MPKPSPESAESARAAQRAAAAVVALALSVLAVYMVGRDLARHDTASAILSAVIYAPVAAVALVCGWFALRGHVEESRAEMRSGCATGAAVGAVGLVAGVLGPVILTPESNQGPLLGVLVTGPLGAVAGTLIGIVARRARRKPPR